MTRNPAKPKKCKVCKAVFVQYSSFKGYCSPECGAILGVKLVEKQKRQEAAKARKAAILDRQETKAALEKFKRLPDWISETQKVFNQYVRLRDQLAGHTCISSGRVLDWRGNGVDAGHFRSRGSAPHLRFDERNCHSQSKYENRYMSGNAPGYRIGLIARIGLQAVEALEADQTPRKYTIDDLKALKAHYSAKVKELKNLL